MNDHELVHALRGQRPALGFRGWKECRPYKEMHNISVLKKCGSNLIKLIDEHPDVGPVRNQFIG